MKLSLKRVGPDTLVAASDPDRELLDTLPYGEEIEFTAKRHRNPKFHAKGMSLFRLGYQYVESVEIQGVEAKPNFDAFRKDVTIKAGFYDWVALPGGRAKMEAKSLSFGSMDEDEFKRVYSAVIDALLQILGEYGLTERDLNNAVNALLEYDG